MLIHKLYKLTVIFTACLFSQTSLAEAPKATSDSAPKSQFELMLGEVLVLLANNGTKYLIAREAPSNDGGTSPPDRKTIITTIVAPNTPKKLLPHDNDTEKSLWDFIQRALNGLVQPKSFLPETPGPDNNPAPQNPWQLRISEDKVFCYLPTQPLTLLLPESQSDKGGQTVTGGFARKETSNGETKSRLWYLNQGAFTPVADHQATQLMNAAKEKAKSETITLHQIPENLTTNQERAAWMQKQNICKRQVHLLSATK